jgi:hemolysin III
MVPGPHLNTQPDIKARGVTFLLFFLAIGVQLAIVLGIFAWIAPDAFAIEWKQGWMIFLWTFLLGVPLSLFEYLYHRYLLHSAVLPFMAAMHRAHTTHHGLTYVKAPVTPKDPAKLVPVSNAYPIEEEHQEESMMFPFYSMLIFEAVFLIILGAPLKLLFPGQPVLVSLILAVAAYLVAYEVWHGVLHLPYERFWQPMMERPWSRKLFRRLYSFHLMHHWRPTSNLAIVGFWGIALWDHALRTHRRPERLPIQGSEVNYHDAKLDQPLWPISALDRAQSKLYKASRAIERFLARVFLGRSTG